jgi:hypothetical protein
MDRAMAHEYHRLPAHGEQIAWDPPWQPQNGFLYSDGPDLTNSQRLILTAGSVVLASLAVIGLMALPVGLILVAVVAFVGIPGLSAIAGIEPRALLRLLFNFWTWAPLILTGTIASAVGGGLGSLVGRRAEAKRRGLMGPNTKS